MKPKRLFEELISLAGKNNIFLDFTCPKSVVAMSMRMKDGTKVISLPPEDIGPIGRTIGPTVLECFAHEMGHCLTDSFYSLYSLFDINADHTDAENKADAWAINFLMKLEDILLFIILDRKTKRKLARHFNVGEEFVEKALQYYKNMNGTPSGIPESKKTLDLSEGEKVWVIKAKFENGRIHTVQIASQEHFERIRKLDAVFYVQSKLSCRTDAEKLGSWVFLTREEAEEALKKITAPEGEGERK